MDIFRLKLFLSAARYLNFTKAAQENFITQPVISRKISELEREIGCKLFYRTSRGVYLTAKGEYLVPKVEEALAILEEGFEYARNPQPGVTESLSIAALTPATHSFLPTTIGKFCARNPSVEINVERMVPSMLQSAMALESHDMYFVMRHIAELYPQYHYRAIRHDELVLITRDTVADLDIGGIREYMRSNMLFLMPEEDSPYTTKLVDAYIKNNNFEYRGIKYIRPIESLLYNISSGLGIMIMPFDITYCVNFKLKAHPLPNAPRLEMGVAWLDEINPYVQEFIDFLDN